MCVCVLLDPKGHSCPAHAARRMSIACHSKRLAYAASLGFLFVRAALLALPLMGPPLRLAGSALAAAAVAALGFAFGFAAARAAATRPAV